MNNAARMAILAAGLALAACKTTTTTVRSEPVIESAKVTATRYRPLTTSVRVDVRDPSHVVISVMTPLKCLETTTTTLRTVVTDKTVVGDAERANAKTIQLAGAAVAGLGVVGGAAASLVTIYEPSRRSGDAFVPVAEQDGFALWPVGVGVAAVSVLVGAPAIAAPWIVGAQEGEVSHDERSEQKAEAESAACAREAPMVGPVTLHIPIGENNESRALGVLESGRFVFDATVLDQPLLDYVFLDSMQPQLDLGQKGSAVSVMFGVEGDRVRMAEFIQAGPDDNHGDEAAEPLATMPVAAFPKLKLAVDAAAVKEAAEKAKQAAIDAAAKKKREAEEARQAVIAEVERKREAAERAKARREAERERAATIKDLLKRAPREWALQVEASAGLRCHTARLTRAFVAASERGDYAGAEAARRLGDRDARELRARLSAAMTACVQTNPPPTYDGKEICGTELELATEIARTNCPDFADLL